MARLPKLTRNCPQPSPAQPSPVGPEEKPDRSGTPFAPRQFAAARRWTRGGADGPGRRGVRACPRRRPRSGVVADQPAGDAGVGAVRGSRDHRRGPRHRGRRRLPQPVRLGDHRAGLQRHGRAGPRAGRPVLGRGGHRRSRPHRRPRTRIGHHRRRAGREDPLRPGDAGIQRPAGLGPGRQPTAGGWHRRRHQVRGRPRRPDHRPAARPRDAGPDGQRRSGRGGRQPGRAGRGRRRAEQGHRAGGTRR